MQLHTILFNVPRRGSDYDRLARVLARSVEVNSPGTPLELHYIELADPELEGVGRNIKATIIDNARKTKHHCQIVQDTPDGELICLLDCDTMVLGDLSEMDRDGFDFAYTMRPEGSRYPINSGVVFVRVSHITKAFYRDWYANVQVLLNDPGQLAHWKPRYGGINQCGLAATLREYRDILTTAELPCPIWNCENESWKHFGEFTKVVHLVPPLRQAVLKKGGPRRPLKPQEKTPCHLIRERWQAYEKELALERA